MASITEYIEKETGLRGEWEPIVDMFCPACKEPEYCYLFDDNKTGYCMACGKEFDVADVLEMAGTDKQSDYDIQFTDIDGNTSGVYLSEEFADANKEAGKQLGTTQQKSIPGFKPNGQQWNYTGYVSNICTHTPQHVIEGRGFGVWAGKKGDCLDVLDKFDVVLNLTFTSVKGYQHKIPIPELQKYENVSSKYKEIQLDWPDYGITNLPRQFWVDLLEYLQAKKAKMLVFCLGGHGRTGTAIASLLVCMGYTPTDAIRWVRKNYCDEAIESQSQEQYIKWMAQKPECKETKRKKESKQLEISAGDTAQ